MNKDADERLWTPVFIVIIVSTLFAFVVGQGTNSGTSVFLSRTGGSATFAGILAAVFSGAAAVTRLICGPIIDSKGRKAIMVVGGITMIIGTVGPIFASAGPIFVLWRFLQGAGFAATTTASATAAADVLPLKRLGEGIGYYGLGQAIAMSIGPAFALFLVATDPATNLYLGISGAALISLIFAVACRYEKRPQTLPPTSSYRTRIEEGKKPCSETKRVSILERHALPGTIPMTIICPAFGFGIFFTGLLGTKIGVASAGVFYTISAIAMILIRLKSKSFMDTVAAIKIYTAAVICGILAFSMLLVASLQCLDAGMTQWVYYLAGIPYGLCLGIALPINQSVAVKNTPAERWGACNALFLLANDIGIGLSCVLWGAINDTLGFSASIVGVLAFIAVSYLVAWVCYPAAEKTWKA